MPISMRYFFSIIILSLLTIACGNNSNKKSNGALVKVGNKILYRNMLEEKIFAGLSREDSIIAAEHFIRTWINEILLYNIASKNIYDKEGVERLVENYRKSLLIYQYEEQLVNERLTKDIDEQTLYDYYNQNKDKLKLENPLVKGLFLKVPINAPQVNEIRVWYKSKSASSRESWEKYRLNNAAVYNYFIDKWADYYDIMNNFPKDQLNNRDDMIPQRKALEKQDNDYFYFLNITECLMAGDNAPYEYAKATIQEILINQRKIDFLKKMEEALYQRALGKGEIQFFDE